MSPKRLHVALVTHGGENRDKGGPTTRVALLQSELEARGHIVERLTDLDAVEHDTRFDIIHVFNSWPLDSSLKQLELARAFGSKVVFSPIALNLENQPFAEQAVPALLEQASSESQVVAGFEFIRSVIDRLPGQIADLAAPVEGFEGHFESLRSAINLSDFVIHLSEYERDFLASLNVRGKPSTIVRNAAPPVARNPGRAENFRRRFDIDRFALNVGRIETRKNQAALALACRLADMPLVCIGGAPDPAYFDLVKEWGPERFVHIPHTNDPHLLAGAYSAASVFCLPSWSEGAPMSALEAEAAGTPLILSTESGERECFGDRATYVHPCDIGHLKDTLAAYNGCQSRKRDEVIGSQGSERGNSFQNHVEQTLAAYRDALPSRAESIGEKHHGSTLSVYRQATFKVASSTSKSSPFFLSECHLRHVELLAIQRNKKYRFVRLKNLILTEGLASTVYRLLTMLSVAVQIRFTIAKESSDVGGRSMSNDLGQNIRSLVQTSMDNAFFIKIHLRTSLSHPYRESGVQT